MYFFIILFACTLAGAWGTDLSRCSPVENLHLSPDQQELTSPIPVYPYLASVSPRGIRYDLASSVQQGGPGLMVGLANGNGDPELSETGALFANIRFPGEGTAGMEVPLTIGSALLTHIYTDAAPTISLAKPRTTSSVFNSNNDNVDSTGSERRGADDNAEKYKDIRMVAQCFHNKSVVITIDLGQHEYPGIEHFQYTMGSSYPWEVLQHPMHVCRFGSHRCVHSGSTVTLNFQTYSYFNKFAINIINMTTLPFHNWEQHPYELVCDGTKVYSHPEHDNSSSTSIGKRDDENKAEDAIVSDQRRSINDIRMTAQCFHNKSVEIKVDLSAVKRWWDHGHNGVQYAMESTDHWDELNHAPDMHACDLDGQICQFDNDTYVVTISLTASNKLTSFAINLIGLATLPMSDWQEDPYLMTCDDSFVYSHEDIDPAANGGHIITIGKRRDDPREIRMTATCNSDLEVTIKIELGHVHYPGIEHFQYAIGPKDQWRYYTHMHTCRYGTHRCAHNGSEVILNLHAYSNVSLFAVNIIGLITIPETDWAMDPYELPCDGSIVYSHEDIALGAVGKRAGDSQSMTLTHTQEKFIIELEDEEFEPLTEKYVVYFTEPMHYHIFDDVIRFMGRNGQKYSGVMQIGYLGRSSRGDSTNNDFYHNHFGIFPYKPTINQCIDPRTETSYRHYNWNPVYATALHYNASLLMLASPQRDEHILQLGIQGKITPYSQTGYIGTEWTVSRS